MKFSVVGSLEAIASVSVTQLMIQGVKCKQWYINVI